MCTSIYPKTGSKRVIPVLRNQLDMLKRQRTALRSASARSAGALRVATWNIAAVNNNPFEYHTDHKDRAHTDLMAACEEFILDPGARDITVGECLPDCLIGELQALMDREGWTGVEFQNA